jgi:putative transposase
LEQRITAYQRRYVSLSRYQQEAQLKEMRAAMSEYAAIHGHVLQDVLARLDKTYQAFFRRIQRGEKAGFPRFKGRNRFHSFTFNEYGRGARLDNGSLVLSKIRRIRVHWSRPIAGTPKTITVSKEADGWSVAISCTDVPLHTLPSTGQQTGIDLGLESFATLASGQPIFAPRYYRRAELPVPLPAGGSTTAEREQSPQEGGGPAGQGASAHRPAALRLPSPRSLQACASVRCDLS